MRHAAAIGLGLLIALGAAVPVGAAIPASADHTGGPRLAPTGYGQTLTPEQRRTSAPSSARQAITTRHAIPLRRKAPAANQMTPTAPASGSAAAASRPTTPDSATAPRAVIFDGLNQPGLAAANSSPSDSTGAIGPNDYIETVNTSVRLYDRDLVTATATRTLGNFIGFPTDDVFDPQMQWDEQAQRYLFVMDDIDPSNGNYLAFGWSKTADPATLTSTDWCTSLIFTGTDLADYPKLGHDDTRLLIGANMFDSGNNFTTARIYALPKPANGVTTCSTPNYVSWGTSAADPLLTFDGDTAFTPVPVNTFGASTNGYVVAADSGTGDSQLTVWHVEGAANSPVLVTDMDITVSDYSVPALTDIEVPQPGTAKVIDGLDGRLTQAVAVADPDASGALAIWTQHTILTDDDRSRVRWYEIVPSAVTPLRQEGNIDLPGLFAFNGAISPAADGNDAVINYNVAGSALNVEIRAQSRTTSTPMNTMESEVALFSSTTYDRDFTCDPGPCRWGDYAGASPDPVHDTVVWGTSMANGPFTSDPHWVTRNFALTPVLPSGDSTPPDVAVPTRNIDFVQSLGATVQMNVSWPAATDDSGIDHYDLQMKTGSGSWVPVSLSLPTATSADVALKVGTNYAFRVRATDGAANTGSWATTTSAHLSLLQEKASAISYNSGWTRVSLSGASGGYVKKATTSARQATLHFSGTSAALVTTLGPARGVLRVRVDGGDWTTVDLYAPSLQKMVVCWAATSLGPGTHTIDAYVAGTRNPSSTSNRIDIDAFLVQP